MDDHQTILVIAAFVAMMGGIWAITERMRDELKKTISLMFKRFDDHKDAIDKKLLWNIEIGESKYVRQDLCQQTKETFKDEFKRINEKLDLLLKERRAND